MTDDIAARAKSALGELVDEVTWLRAERNRWKQRWSATVADAEAARAERDRLAATVERVRELSMQVAHDPDVEGMTLRDMGAIDHALAVLAALEGIERGEDV